MIGDKMKAYLTEMEELLTAEQKIKQRITELKSLIYEELSSEEITGLETETLKVTKKDKRKVSVPRENSMRVYELLEENGYDCRAYSWNKRTKYIERILEENKELPEWLRDSVCIEEKHDVEVKVKSLPN